MEAQRGVGMVERSKQWMTMDEEQLKREMGRCWKWKETKDAGEGRKGCWERRRREEDAGKG